MSINFAEYDDHDNEFYYEEFSINSNEKYETFVDFVSIETSCLQCKKIFSSRNKLHKHLKTKCKAKSMNKLLTKNTNKNKNSEKSKMFDTQLEKSIIIKSTVFKIDKKYDLVFKKWNYVEVIIKLKFDLKKNYVCLNTSIEASLIDKQFVFKKWSKIHIHLMISFLTIRKIEINVHEIKKYVNFSIYLSSKEDSKKMTKIYKKIVSRQRS
jgi:hypothetical protein